MSGGPGRTNFQDSLRRFPQAAGSQVPFIRGTAKALFATGTLSQKTHWMVWDSMGSGFAGMTFRQQYLLKAAELGAKAQAENDQRSQRGISKPSARLSAPG